MGGGREEDVGKYNSITIPHGERSEHSPVSCCDEVTGWMVEGGREI